MSGPAGQHLYLVLVRRRSRGGGQAGRRRHTMRSNARCSSCAASSRRSREHLEALIAEKDSDRRGATRRERRDPIEQRGVAVDQRGAGDRQGRAAVDERGAAYGQRGARGSQRPAQRSPTTTSRVSSRACICRSSWSTASCVAACDAAGRAPGEPERRGSSAGRWRLPPAPRRARSDEALREVIEARSPWRSERSLTRTGTGTRCVRAPTRRATARVAGAVSACSTSTINIAASSALLTPPATAMDFSVSVGPAPRRRRPCAGLDGGGEDDGRRFRRPDAASRGSLGDGRRFQSRRPDRRAQLQRRRVSRMPLWPPRPARRWRSVTSPTISAWLLRSCTDCA